MRLRSTSGRVEVALAIRLHCRTVERYRPRRAMVVLAAYSYKFEDASDAQRELLRFDWHPHVAEEVRFPHVHVPTATTVGLAAITGRTHLPTPFLTIADVCRFAILELGIAAPTRARWPADGAAWVAGE